MANFDRLENTTTLIVNSHRVEIPGVGNANEGRLTSRFKHNFKFPIEILAPMMIVGYPTYSEYKGSARDLFKPSTLQGGYKYQRAYRFSNGARFTSFHNILFDAAKHRLNGTFSTINFPEDRFVGDWRIRDLLETFIPHAPGVIKSVMAVEWHDASELLHAIIESEYYFNHNETLPGLHWRHVKFATNHKGAEYTQSEKITVIDQLDFGAPANQFEAFARATSADTGRKAPALV
jgi:Green fluorescent protein